MKHHFQTFWRNWIAKDWAVVRAIIQSDKTTTRLHFLSNKYAPSVYWSVHPDEAYCTWRWHANSVGNQLTRQMGEIYKFRVVQIDNEKDISN